MTLVEVMIAMATLALTLTAMLQVVVNLHVNAVDSRDRVTAVQDAKAVVDQMRGMAAQGANVPGDIVGAFPAGPFTQANISLPAESVTIQYENVALNPLFVTVTTQWRDAHGRTRQETYSTAVGRN